jgi:hypothetical protein
MVLRVRNDKIAIEWRCRKRGADPHDISESAVANSWFEKSKLTMEKIMIITYMFSQGWTNYNTLIHETSIDDTETSRPTIVEWINRCRDVCFIWINNHLDAQGLIGGEGKIIEIDEVKIGKRKYNRGRIVEGQWILGMIEILPEGDRKGGAFRLEVCPDNKRDASTLLTLIKKHVAPGSTIVTDLWRGYFGLEGEGFYHLTVNHAQEFINPVSGANTQIIESSWCHPKKKVVGGIPHDRLVYHLYEYFYRRDIKIKNLILFSLFLML